MTGFSNYKETVSIGSSPIAKLGRNVRASTLKKNTRHDPGTP